MSPATETLATPADLQPEIPDVPVYRLSVEQYHAMARAGILDEDAPVELVEGWLVQKMTKYPPHTRHQDYGASDTLPVLLAGAEVGHLEVSELLP